MADGGIRGIRFTVFDPRSAAVSIDMIEPLAKRVADLGWHVQIHMRADQIVENAALLEGLPTQVVFDHLGRLPQPAPLDHAGLRHHPPHARQGPHLDEAVRRLHGHE